MYDVQFARMFFVWRGNSLDGMLTLENVLLLFIPSSRVLTIRRVEERERESRKENQVSLSVDRAWTLNNFILSKEDHP